ncbi:esterase family protein [Streptosporangiaceae bacterium NEAU-GS5]|nr:esterase family protein [Streptosporangiaceae bacterium NEAU-GS5]
MKAVSGALVLTLALAACAPAAQPPKESHVAAEVVSAEPAGARTDKLMISSPALGEERAVWVVKPAAWTAGSKGWRVLYLLHGCCGGGAWDWLESGEVEQVTAGLNAVVIVPEGGPMGWYADWRRGPAWETFHTSELPALLEPRYGVSGPRSIAGYSMGGHGAFMYAARHPGMYVAAAALSGVLDTRKDVPGFQSFLRSHDIDTADLWGDPDAWAAHNPTDVAAALKGVRLYVSCGDGRPGPLDPAQDARSVDETEQGLLTQNHHFVDAAEKARVPVTTDFYGPGTHTWPYWIRSLRHALPILLP